MSSIFAVLVQCYSMYLLIKTDSTVICVPRMLEHVCYEPFPFKNLEGILRSVHTIQFRSNYHLEVYCV